jgi:F-type H+-transporting ATPase subunit delta
VAQADSIISGVAARYARSLFELAEEAKSVASVESDLDAFEALIEASPDLNRLVRSPVFSADDQVRAMDAILDKAKVKGLVGNFLRVVARNRRLFIVPDVIRSFRQIAAEARGEAAADVVSAHELSAAQLKELQATLKSVVGKSVTVNLTIDPSILGGLIVRVGSRQIDTSLKTKLNSLKLALKEVG